MAELKTKARTASVATFIAKIKDPEKQEDAKALVKLMRAVTGAPPIMWGPSIIGFGTCHYKYASGREGDWFLAGFSPRAADMTIYVMSGFAPHRALLEGLGPHKIGKGCLYFKSLGDIRLPILKTLLTRSVKALRAMAA